MTIQEISKSIDEDIRSMLEECDRDIQETREKLEIENEAFKKVAIQNDRSENAEFTETLKQLSLLNSQMANLHIKKASISGNVDYSNYNSVGLVKLYSTVRIYCEHTGKEYYYKLFPAGISDLKKRVLAVDSELGAELLNKRVGDDVTTQHTITGEEILFEIREVY